MALSLAMCELWEYFPLILLGGAFPSLGSYPLVRALISTQGGTALSSATLSCKLSLLWPAWTPSGLLILGRPPGLPRFPLPALWPGNLLQVISWKNCRAHLLCFPSRGITALFYWLSDALGTTVPCILSRCQLFQIGGYIWLLLIQLGWERSLSLPSLISSCQSPSFINSLNKCLRSDCLISQSALSENLSHIHPSMRVSWMEDSNCFSDHSEAIIPLASTGTDEKLASGRMSFTGR